MYSSAPKANTFYCAKVLFERGMGWISDGCLCLVISTHPWSEQTEDLSGAITTTHKVYKHSNFKRYEVS